MVRYLSALSMMLCSLMKVFKQVTFVRVRVRFGVKNGGEGRGKGKGKGKDFTKVTVNGTHVLWPYDANIVPAAPTTLITILKAVFRCDWSWVCVCVCKCDCVPECACVSQRR